MEIKDIIKTDADRLFIVDPECYILFTGETKDDIQPFIRIGNWMDMPIELIPLVENIIITDSLIGNPSHEQFNIDVRYLSTNRYIGSRSIVVKFLEYQKIFGLDLANASVVDIEKDLPVLSAEKNISYKNQFIGVFYRDGNFKVLLNKNTIFDLNKIIRNPITNHNFHDLLSEAYADSKRYDSSGIVIVGHNPIFYHKKYFYSYLFPASYFYEFSLLGIDPGKIQTVFHPSPNLINISKFFKWLNYYQKKIRIFANTADIALVKKIFSNCAIKNEKFSSLAYKAGSGLSIKNYPGSYNLKLQFEAVPPHGNSLTAAFIKGSSGVKAIFKEKLDALIITYTAFEDIHLLLKSTGVPYVIVDDGNKNIAKLGPGDQTILHRGIQYEFRMFDSFDALLALPVIDDAALSGMRSDPDALAGLIQNALENKGADRSHEKNLFNLLSIVLLHLRNTKNRKTSSKLKNLADALRRSIVRSSQFEDASRFTVVLALYHGSIFPVIADYAAGPGRQEIRLFDEIGHPEADTIQKPVQYMQDHYNRILSDRDRLRKLIEIYMASEQYGEKNMAELKKLDKAIAARKEQYNKENLSLDHAGAGDMRPGRGKRESKKAKIPIAAPETPDTHTGAPEIKIGKSLRATRSASISRIVKIIVPVAILVIIALLLFVTNSDKIKGLLEAEKGGVIQSREIDTRFSELAKKLNIRIKDHDVLDYANRVAVKNGYHRIAETRIKYKNPDWIYPDNIFIMLDGQKVIVSKGDTLWNLSRNKLVEATIAFNAIMKKINTADEREKALLIERAKRHAYTGEQQELLKKTIGKLPPGIPRDPPK